MQGVDVHALDLSGLGADSLHAGDPDCVVARDRQQEPTVRSLKLGESAQVALDKPADRQPEAVSVFKPVVAPSEVASHRRWTASRSAGSSASRISATRESLDPLVAACADIRGCVRCFGAFTGFLPITWTPVLTALLHP